jgi:hypothetical protein
VETKESLSLVSSGNGPSTALAPRAIVTSGAWNTIMAIAPVVHQSRLFPVTSPQAAAVIMLKGYELGLNLTAAFEFIHVIQGRPSLSPKGALALILRSGELQEFKITEGEDFCECYMKRRNGFTYVARFSMEDAKQAQVVKPDSGWEKYPKNMLRWRSIGFTSDIVFPDILCGMIRADDLGALITPDGDVIEGEFKVTSPGSAAAANPSSATVSPETCAAPEIKLDALLAEYGPVKILAANDGKVPASQAEVEAVAAKLGHGPNGNGHGETQ